MTDFSHRLIPVTETKEWVSALQGVPYAAAHLPQYNKAISRSGDYRPLLYVLESSTVKMVCPLAERQFKGHVDLFSLYGNGGVVAIGDDPRILEEMRSFLRRQGYVAAFVSLSQTFDPPSSLAVTDENCRNTVFVCDLSQSSGDLWASIGKNNRRHIRNWRATKFKLVLDQAPLKEAFMTMYPTFMDRLGAAAHYRMQREVFDALFTMENVYLIGAEENDNIVAVRCFLFTPYVVDAFLEAHLEGASGHSRAIYWAAFEHFHSLDVPLMNMGGGIKEGDSLAFFKKSFGGRQRPLHSLKLVLDVDRYEALCRQVNVDAGYESFFPAYYGTSGVIGSTLAKGRENA